MSRVSGAKHFLDYWVILKRRRWVIYLALVTALLFASIGSFVVTPLYQATSTIQIERMNPDIFLFRDVSQVDFSWAAYSDFYETQYKIIASEAVARKAAERLGLAEHPDFTTESSPGLLSRLKNLFPEREHDTELEPLDLATLEVQSALSVTAVRNSHLVEISWISPEPQLAADVANAVSSAYIEYNIEAQYVTTAEAKGFLINQIELLKREISVTQAVLQTYGEDKNIVSIDDANNITLNSLQGIAGHRTEAQARLEKTRAANRAAMDTPAAGLPAVMESDLIAHLRQEYALYEAEFSEKARRFGEEWPGMQVLSSKLEQARTRLDTETEHLAAQVRASTEAAYQRALAEVQNLERLLLEQQNLAQDLKRDAVEFVNLESEVRKKREMLDALVVRQGQMALSSRLKDLDETSTNVRIMEPARVPPVPFRPNTRMNLALGLFFGLFTGLGMALLLDYLDNTVGTPAELAHIVNLPILAVVPRHRVAEEPVTAPRPSPVEVVANFDMVSHLDRNAAASEAYRELRTAILLSHPGHPPRRMVVTSSVPQEGKTATAINLAVVLAQLGRRVVLVDTDLRRARQHRAFGQTNTHGVSTYLSGLEQDVSRLIRQTEIEGLDLLTSGPIPPNPSELLNSPPLHRALRRAARRSLRPRHLRFPTHAVGCGPTDHRQPGRYWNPCRRCESHPAPVHPAGRGKGPAGRGLSLRYGAELDRYQPSGSFVLSLPVRERRAARVRWEEPAHRVTLGAQEWSSTTADHGPMCWRVFSSGVWSCWFSQLHFPLAL